MDIDLTPPDCLFDVLKKASNATLTFYLAGGDPVIDSETGNVLPSANTPTTIQATCHFERMPQHIAEQYKKAQDQRMLYVRGRAVDPTSFPAGIGHLSEGTATINGRTGKTILLNPEISPYVETALGTHFYLLFIEGEAR